MHSNVRKLGGYGPRPALAIASPSVQCEATKASVSDMLVHVSILLGHITSLRPYTWQFQMQERITLPRG